MGAAPCGFQGAGFSLLSALCVLSVLGRNLLLFCLLCVLCVEIFSSISPKIKTERIKSRAANPLPIFNFPISIF